ncbi:MAG: valine--tRNA ligase [Planctomycetota bacterium]|jgi:valyl-tRNA synthetase
MADPLPKVYDPRQVEERWVTEWIEKNYFHSEPDDRDPYTIVIPPPNITGVLHMGHGLNNTYQDVLTRWRRMQGRNALWLPGTDHAAIATTNVVERELAAEGLKREDVGREKFLERTWQWREEYGGTIIHQLKRMGCSCDWPRERFTMDEGLSRAVREAFVRFFEDGLIYRGLYIVNWCPRCGTALSDDEVDHEDVQGHLWYIRYPLKDSDAFLTVATTRPETMLGDTGVAVNPADERFRGLVGKTAVLPVIGREIPVIADDFVDPKFGTGMVKVTPAHDPNDFEIGRRHDLPDVVVIAEDGTMTAEAGEYSGLDRFECRKRLIERLECDGLLEKTEEYLHAVGHCYRCKTVIEPYISEQWFVRVKELVEPAIAAANDGRVTFHPERWTRVYLSWLENVRDWCISRQIWWGHRIPAWYCDDCGEVFAAREDPSECRKCSSNNLRQDEDTLDTWFSSALWPFSTLGWPDETKDLDYYYPTDVLVTDRGIIFFWVARMVMMGLRFRGEVPFDDVYINATVLDEQGRKMSKSLGNGIDPLEIIEQYGADAMRFSLMLLTAEGQDVKLSPTRFEMGRNFANKLWNAARFALMNLEDFPDQSPVSPGELEFEDRWILSRLSHTAGELNAALEGYHFHAAAHLLYDFAWHSLCDWYLEAIKPRLYGSRPESKRVAQKVLAASLDALLRMLHPFVPFITEEVWSHLGELVPDRGLFEAGNASETVSLADWPQPESFPRDEAAETKMPPTIDCIRAVRNIRSSHNLGERAEVDVVVRSSSAAEAEAISEHEALIKELAGVRNIRVVGPGQTLAKPRHSAAAVFRSTELFIPLEGLIDLAAEKERLTSRINKARRNLSTIEGKLSNPNFVERAPSNVVERERERRAAVVEEIRKLEANLHELAD